MDNFLERWRTDKKFRTAVKLIGYVCFVLIVAIYALSSDTSGYGTNKYLEQLEAASEAKKETKKEDTIKLEKEYEYKITIEIDDKKYEYSGTQNETERTIEKKVDNKTTKYVYKDNTYYIEDEKQTNNYMITTKEEVYDIINYNYINIDTINEYLSKAEKNNNQYLVYIKDIVLGNDSNNYFVIDVNDNNIFIDYTALMKEFNSNIKKYKVSIEIKE